jgi:hypothetical protein
MNRLDEIVNVDVCDTDSLTSFCRGCRIIVNCAGPSFYLMDLAARGAFAAGADYVDPGGDESLYRRLASLDPKSADRVALIAAGMMPGLSALLVRWLVLEVLEGATQLLTYVGGRGHLSPAAAVDYVLSLGQAERAALAIWQDGGRIARALKPVANFHVPFFPSGITAYPYLSTEVERVARTLGLSEVRWYNVFEGGHMFKTLAKLQGAALGETDVDWASAELSKAAELDLFGLEPYQIFYMRLKVERNAQPFARGLLVRGASAQALTACMVALATEALLSRGVSPGVYFAGETLALSVVNSLRRMHGIKAFELIETAPESDLLDDGEL